MIDAPVFLGWQAPALQAAVEWLHARYGAPGAWDMQNVLVAVPGSRGGRRLLQLLVERAAAGQVLLTPPEIVTVGRLPEALVVDPPPAASPATCLVAWATALREAPSDAVAAVFPARPDGAGLAADLGLAAELHRVRTELAAAGHTVEAAAVCAAAAGRPFPDAARWTALAALDRRYEAVLARAGLADAATVRRALLAGPPAWRRRDVVLLATADLSAETRALLAAAAAAGVRVTPLVDAEASVAGGFDALGVVVPGYWAEARLPLDERRFVAADRPTDQVGAVLRFLSGLGGVYGPDDVTIGLGDPALGPALERALDLAGVPARRSTGRPVAGTGPATLLAAAAQWIAEPSAARFAALVRHPDLERWLAAVDHGLAAKGPLATLDEHRAEHLPATLGSGWPTGRSDTRPIVAALFEKVSALFAPLRAARPLAEGAPAACAVLEAVYGARRLRRGDPDDEPVIDGLRKLGGALGDLRAAAAALGLADPVEGPEVVRLALALAADAAVPEPADGPAVELLGWLELALDDAPVVAVTGFNEGLVPESLTADVLLPDALRRRLGLLDNAGRYARDAARLASLLKSRREILLVAGRRGDQGDPLNPSRLLFAADEVTIAERARAFFAGAGPHPAPATLSHGAANRFAVPRPVPPAAPLEELDVTAFRAYLRCPYRFWLGHVLELAPADDDLVELDARGFGTLAHRVLQAFATSAAADATDADTIAAFLAAEVDSQVAARLGAARLPAVDLQAAQLKRRFARFAAWQAGQRALGWTIVPRVSEAKITARLDVDGTAFRVVGRMDRVDVKDGVYRILDYKTGDTPRTPDETHREKGTGRWVDLQLPLYSLLAASAGLPTGSLELGYVCLAAKPGDVYQPAPWGAADIDDALAVAASVVRNVRAGVFWPPAELREPDEFAGIALDRCLDRARYLAPATEDVR